MQSRRDVGNEVIVALAVIGMLALALTFGVVLTLTRTVPPEGTGTVAATNTQAVTEDTGTDSATQAVTVEATQPVTQGVTQEPTTRATAVAQVTVADATATHTPTTEPTQIVYPTRRPRTTVPTATNTSTTAPTTSVPTATTIPATYPPRRTRTPSFTPSPLPTYPPRRTRTPSPVVSPIPPTVVPTTPAVTATATRIVDAGILPTPTPTITPTVLATLTTTPLPTIAIATSCAPRTDWVRYTVQPGDTLFSIARQARITLAELQQANCISNPNTIFYGRVIVIPPGTVIATVTPGGTVPASGTGNAALCPNPDVRITSPISGSKFSGILSITGTARAANFANYQIEFQPEGTFDWVRTAFSSTPVTDGLLGRFDPNPSQLPAGNFLLRLRIEVTGGSAPPPCVIKVTLVR